MTVYYFNKGLYPRAIIYKRRRRSTNHFPLTQHDSANINVILLLNDAEKVQDIISLKVTFGLPRCSLTSPSYIAIFTQCPISFIML